MLSIEEFKINKLQQKLGCLYMLNHIDTDISPLPFVFMLYKNSPLSGLLLCLQSVVIKTTTTTKPEKPN